jgi:hypothetical protein
VFVFGPRILLSIIAPIHFYWLPIDTMLLSANGAFNLPAEKPAQLQENLLQSRRLLEGNVFKTSIKVD